MSSGELPRAALFCAAYLDREAHHVWRHVNALRGFRPVLITQKARGHWPGIRPVIVRRAASRELGRMMQRLAGVPWRISRREAASIGALMRTSGCRLLHVFTGDAALHLLPLLRRTSVPFLVSFHGADVAGEFARFGSARREIFARAFSVPCRSRDLAARVVELGCPREKIRIMPAVLPDFPGSGAGRQPPSDGRWRILQAGRLIPKKGFLSSVRAFALFRREFPSAEFVIAGEGPLRGQIERLAEGLGVAEGVRFAGFLDQAGLSAEFGSAHLYLHPSETAGGDREGIPNALLEAMASGLPPVATRHGGIPEAVRDGISGLLCAEGDAPGLAEAMARLARDASFYHAVSEAASEEVRVRFGREAAIGAIEDIYREAVADSACPADGLRR